MLISLTFARSAREIAPPHFDPLSTDHVYQLIDGPHQWKRQGDEDSREQ